MPAVIEGEIRKDRNQDFEPIVRMKIGEEEFDFLVDTGASAIVMSALTLERLVAKVNGPSLFRTTQEESTIEVVGGDIPAHVYVGRVEIGGKRFSKEIYGIVGEPEGKLPVLGRSVLKEFTTVLEKDTRIYLK